MSKKIFNEDTRVKIPASIQFMRIGYDYQSLSNAEIDFETKIFTDRFHKSLEKINKRSFTGAEIHDILMEINSVIKNTDLGKEFYGWLINPLSRVKLIDFDDIDNNDFAIVDELPFCISKGTEEGSFRPDITVLINGMPLSFLEVKKPNNDGGIQVEFERMINKRLKNAAYKKFFNLIQMVSFSNNMEYENDDEADDDVKAGSFYTTPNGINTSFSFFREDDTNFLSTYAYKNIGVAEIKAVTTDCGYNSAVVDTAEFEENLKTDTPCNSFITSVFDKERVLYFLKYGMMYIDGTTPQKHVMRYPQFFATRKIIERLEGGGKGGIIWHTQGSGKTGLAAFSNRILIDYFANQNINARMFFVVDRLDLLTQASTEFKNRGLNVINCNSKSDFTKELNKTLSTNIDSSATGEMCVVNIHKFEDDIPKTKNDYNAKIQRIFFIDEAHRSYSSKGEFYKNLMTCDTDAIYIALTGTPLLNKKERSNLKFGDYIHKYFYDKSIADGYTLRIKKETIDTVAKSEIKRNLEVEDGDLDKKDVYESDAYVEALGNFIVRDFDNFRLQNSDNSIGGMIVCRSNFQAKKVHDWFADNSKLKTGLVISDEDPKQSLINKTNQTEFRESGVPDILVVNMMLTTGYDVKRLKKMYLLRGPHAQTLLQTISRVNRPYKSPNGKIYKYGYIVDFVDIEAEYDNTIEAYIKELEADMNENSEDSATLAGLVVDKEDINNKYHKYVKEVDDIVSTDNLERFSKQLLLFNKQTILKIKRLLNGIKSCHTEFLLSRADDYAAQIDIAQIKKLIHTAQERINFLNLSTNAVGMMDVISNEEVVDILYEFIKTKISIIDLGKFTASGSDGDKFTKAVMAIQNEIKNNKNKDDIKVVKLDEMLKRIFDKLSFLSDISELNEITDELLEALADARAINNENDRLSTVYNGNYGFVKTYTDASEKYSVDKSDLEKTLIIIFNDIKDNIDGDTLLVQGRKNFIDTVKGDVTKLLLKEKLYAKVKDFYDQLISELYTNIQLFR